MSAPADEVLAEGEAPAEAEVPAAAQPQADAATEVVCASCGAKVGANDAFCEGCGAALTPLAAPASPEPSPSPPGPSPSPPDGVPPDGVLTASPDLSARATVCAQCAGAVAADGYCEQCGAPASRPRDHWLEQPVAWVAAVCDRGIRHGRNEDAVALAARSEPGSFAALVVCDGVSSSTDPDVASLAAARAARDVLAATPADLPDRDPAVDDPAVDDPRGAARVHLLTGRMDDALVAANAAASRVATGRDQPSPPSCTFVAAVVDGPRLVYGWVGDSRAYWFPDVGEPMDLSVDDSWATQAMRHGLSRAEAERMPQAHAITRWLGIDAPDIDAGPGLGSCPLTGPGWVLLCSDGLWNYCSEPQALADLVHARAASVDGEPARLAGALVDWANGEGGHDNITVAVARIT